jgi:hypothetical protein
MRRPLPEAGSTHGNYRVVKIEHLGLAPIVVFCTGKSKREQALGLDSWFELIDKQRKTK